MSKNQYKILKKEENKGEVTVEVEVDVKLVDSYKDQAIKDYQSEVEIDGFRKGHVPANIIVEKVGEMALFEKCAYKALNNIIPVLVTEEKIDALTQPSVSITKLAPGSPVTFKMTVTLMPELTLPDYKSIAKSVETKKAEAATDKELEEYIDYIRKQRRDSIAMSKNEKIDEKAPLPELDDAFVKTLGDFKNVDDFKKQLKENMSSSKEQKEHERRRLEIIEKIIKDTKGDIHQVLIDQELENMMNKFRNDIERMGMKFEDYIKEIKKSEEDLRKEWKVDAEKRVKMNMILPKIAEQEKLKVDPKTVKKEVEHIKEHQKDIDEMHATLYVTNVLTNEEVFKFLENIK